MSMPLLNAVAVNAPLGASAAVPDEPTAALVPGALINAGLIGSFVVNAASTQQSQEPEQPVVLGPSALINEGMLNTFLIGAAGTVGGGAPLPEPQPQPQSFTVGALAPVRFGVVQVLVATAGVSFPVSGLRAAYLGQPRADLLLQAGQVPGIARTQLGQPALRVHLPAQGLQPVQLGTPSIGVALRAQGLRAVQLGVPTSVQNTGAGSIAPVRLGPLRVVVGGLALQANGLRCAALGTPSLGGIRMRARALGPARMGRPVLHLEHTC